MDGIVKQIKKKISFFWIAGRELDRTRHLSFLINRKLPVVLVPGECDGILILFKTRQEIYLMSILSLIYISLPLSLFLFILFIGLYLCLCLSDCLSVCLPVTLSLSLSLSLCLSLSLSLSLTYSFAL